MHKLVARNPGLVRALFLVALLATWLLALPRRDLVVPLVVTALLAATWMAYSNWQRDTAHQAANTAVMEFPFPAFLADKLRLHYPRLDATQVHQVERGLRQFFFANARAGGDYVAMPSRVVDALWHEFILDTRAYEDFCRQAFGRVLHHTPVESMPPGGRDDQRSAGLSRAWFWSCKQENIDAGKPDRLPLLFALDAMLAIPEGHRYVLNGSLLGAKDNGAFDVSALAGLFVALSAGANGGDGGGADAGGGGSSDGGGGGCGGGGT